MLAVLNRLQDEGHVNGLPGDEYSCDAKWQSVGERACVVCSNVAVSSQSEGVETNVSTAGSQRQVNTQSRRSTALRSSQDSVLAGEIT